MDNEISILLEEHRALRNEIEQHHVSMRYITIFNFTASGAIFGFAFSQDVLSELLLFIPILSGILGIIFFFHSKGMSQLEHYIRDKIAPKIRLLTNDDSLLSWENYIREKEDKGCSKYFSLNVVRLLAFIIISAVALISAPGWSEGFSTECLINWWIGLVLTLVLIILTIIERKLWFGMQREQKS